MLRLLSAYSVAVLATQLLPALPPWWVGAAMLLLALAPWQWRPVALAFALGFALTLWRAELRLADRWPAERQGQEWLVQGTVASLPESVPTTWGQGHQTTETKPLQTWRFIFETQQAGLPARIRSSWYRSEHTVRAGECWRLGLKIKTPHGSQNPDGFDYEGWLFRQDLGATATVRLAERCDPVAGYAVLRLRQQLRDALTQQLAAGPARAVMLALVLGDRSELRDDDWTVFRRTGTSHLVAISGFHLAIVAGFAFWLLRWSWGAWPALTRFWPAQKAAALGAAALAAGYALLTGFEPPVARALTMLLVGLAALLLHRPVAPFRVLALAWGAILLLDPFAVLSAGLWLSFAAVAAIIWLASGRLAPERGWRLALRIQLLLSLLLAPLTLFFFQGASWISPLVNLLMVPWFVLLTPLVLGSALLQYLWPAVAGPLLAVAAQAVAATHTVLQALMQAHGQAWVPAAPAVAALGLALLGALLWSAPRGMPLRWLATLCILPLLLPASTAPKRGFDLTVLDVGQGLAVVVRTAQHTLVFDAGPAHDEGFDAGESIVVPYLLGQGVTQVDLLMISHGDLDHRGGAAAVQAALPVRQARGALSAEPCVSGQHWQWDGVQFTVLNGPADAQGLRSPSNNGSCVLKVSVGDHAVLLPADIERDTEARLVLQQARALRADVLIAPHHGSRSSSSTPFVQAVNPDVVIFPAGFANSFRHPRPEVVERYRALGSALHMTGHEGALSLHVDPETGVGAVQGLRRQRPRYWWAAVPPVPGSE
jgi:competence protein ComEC